MVPRVRSLVIFGEHDLGQRPPFPQMDLVLCRNVLIYFTTELQKRALQLFAYALRNGGYLVLGQAEAVTPLAELFTPLQDWLKIYRRQGERILVPPLRPKSPAPPGPLPPIPPLALVPRRSSWRPPPRDALEVSVAALPRAGGAREHPGTLLLGLPVGVAIIDRQYDIHLINSAACHLLGIYRPAVGQDLLHLVTRVPIETLRAALEDAFRPAPLPTTSGQTTVGQTVVVPATGVEAHTTVQLTFYPVADLSPTDAADETVEEGLPADEGEPTEGSRPAGETEAPAEARRPAAVEALFLLVTAGPDLAPDDAATTPSPSRVEPQRSPAGAPPHLTGSRGQARRGALSARQPKGKLELEQELAGVRAELAQVKQQRDHLIEHTREVEAANSELMSANLELRQAREEVLVRQEAFQAADEEVRTVNEELQATNEELETLNEEMEATVEELHTSNDDLMAKTFELQQMAEQREVQRVAAENARARLAAILAQGGEAVLVVDPGGQPLITSAAYTALFGESGSTTTPQVLYDLDGNPLAADATPQARFAHETAPFHLAFLLPAADGAPRWFEAQGQSVLDQQGNRLGGIVTLHELTDRTLRTLEERFLQLAVHELRTPLAIQMVLLGSLQRYLGQPPEAIDSAHCQELTARAVRQTELLRTLIDELADLGRVQSGKLRVSHEPVDLVALLHQIVENLRMVVSADQEGVQERVLPYPSIELQVAPDLGASPWISADALRVGQIFTNLLNNALTYAPRSERIELRVRKVQGQAEVEVADHGPGIPAAEISTLFSPFRQVAQPTNAGRPAGLGLGLFIVAQLVRALDGTIDIHSTPGQGTTFVVRLPLVSAPVPIPGSVHPGTTTHEASPE